jgi:hypothetical protein
VRDVDAAHATSKLYVYQALGPPFEKAPSSFVLCAISISATNQGSRKKIPTSHEGAFSKGGNDMCTCTCAVYLVVARRCNMQFACAGKHPRHVAFLRAVVGYCGAACAVDRAQQQPHNDNGRPIRGVATEDGRKLEPGHGHSWPAWLNYRGLYWDVCTPCV